MYIIHIWSLIFFFSKQITGQVIYRARMYPSADQKMELNIRWRFFLRLIVELVVAQEIIRAPFSEPLRY